MKRRYTRKPGTSDVNMTPMLDIVFIMLIFFIVTASFIVEKGLTVNHPHSIGPRPAEPSANIGFLIDSSNHIYHEGRYIDVWSAEAVIKQRITANPKAPVVLSVLAGSKFKTLIRLYDLALSVGVPAHQIGVVTPEH
ncbi:MAG: biopolymer transporter ExbD [Kordiimonadales bacterium]|nr:MAG: biopolymer transporter ExbD [Kordiimonadales bacterium]